MTFRAQAALPTGQRTTLETALDRLIALLDIGLAARDRTLV